MGRKKTVASCPKCGHPLTYDDVKLLWGRATGQLSRGVEPENVAVAALYCDGSLNYDELKTLWGRATSGRRKTHGAGTGRPRSTERCPCGVMTKKRAELRGHKCKRPKKQ